MAKIIGKFEMNKGDIVFSGPMTIGTDTIYGRFKVEGDILWTGGTYRPVIEIGGTKANVWEVTGTMTVDTSNVMNKPRIEPNFPANQQPMGTWAVIEAIGAGATLQGDDPILPQNWNLVTQSTSGVKKMWSVNK